MKQIPYSIELSELRYRGFSSDTRSLREQLVFDHLTDIAVVNVYPYILNLRHRLRRTTTEILIQDKIKVLEKLTCKNGVCRQTGISPSALTRIVPKASTELNTKWIVESKDRLPASIRHVLKFKK